MHRVFEALSHLLPLGVDEEAFNDPANKAEIERWMNVLAGAAGELHDHGRTRDAGFRNLSRSLASDVEEIRYRYQSGRTDEARYFLIESTNNCVACHSRLPRARDFGLAERMNEQIDMSEMSPHERAQIYVATRQFEKALETWEAQFADEKTIRAVDLDIGGSLLDYLAIAIRVVQDPARARRGLERIAQRNDVPRYLARHLARWIADLKRFEAAGKQAPSLAKARELLGVSESSGKIPFGKELLVSDLLASGVLLRFIDTGKRSDSELAEAFYLLGIAEVRNVDAFWVPQAEFHFEAAIRTQPQGPFAVDAYALLEESILVGYSGSSGLHLPVDVWSTLEELRLLVEGETPPLQ